MLEIVQNNLLLVSLSVVLLAMLLAAIYWSRRGGALQQALSNISFDRINDLVVPNGDEGEILIDHLLLTSQGLLVLEIKNVQGAVFGSDKMQDWTVIASDRRYTFPNPQPGLYDRVAAVREIVRDVPVHGRILFLDGADFTKGTPGQVSTLEQLTDEFGEVDRRTAEVKVGAFKPHWERLKRR